MSDDVMIAVDPHKASNTAAVLDPVTRTLIETARFANSDEGYGRLAASPAVGAPALGGGGCHGAGRSLAQRLVADGEHVLDVPAKLAARVRVYSSGHGRKTDRHDAVSIGLAALEQRRRAPVARDDVMVSLRLLCDRREELAAQRTQAVCRLHRLLAELTRADARELTAARPRRCWPHPARGRRGLRCACTSPATTRRHQGPRRQAQVHRRPDRRPGHPVRHHADQPLRDRPADRGRILAEVGDIARFATRDKFASYNGTAPIDVSPATSPPPAVPCREQADHHALHMMAVTQIRYPATDGPATTSASGRRARPPRRHCAASSGSSPTRSNRQLVRDRQGRIEACGSPTTRPPTPPTSTSPANGSPRPHQHPRHPADGIQAFVVLDWKDNRLVGIEILDASSRLHRDLLDERKRSADNSP